MKEVYYFEKWTNKILEEVFVLKNEIEGIKIQLADTEKKIIDKIMQKRNFYIWEIC